MTKNLIVKISNGFGNQMFLYASAYAFSKKMGYNLLIDDESGIKHDCKKWIKKKRINWIPKYELGIFNLNSSIAKDKYKFLNSAKYFQRKYFKILDKFFLKKRFLIEKLNKNKTTFFSDQYLSQKYHDTTYLEGYFESERYFINYRNDLLKEFSFKLNTDLKKNIFMNIIND